MQKVPGKAWFPGEGRRLYSDGSHCRRAGSHHDFNRFLSQVFRPAFPYIKTSREDIRATQIMMQKLEAVTFVHLERTCKLLIQRTLRPDRDQQQLRRGLFLWDCRQRSYRFARRCLVFQQHVCRHSESRTGLTTPAPCRTHSDRQMQTYYARLRVAELHLGGTPMIGYPLVRSRRRLRHSPCPRSWSHSGWG